MDLPKSAPSPDRNEFIDELMDLQVAYDAYRNLYRRISEDRSWASNPGREPLLRLVAEQGTFVKTLIDRAVEDWFSRW